MTKKGLKNRFSKDIKFDWSFHYSCMVCGKNNFDVLHHIISPTVRYYKTGKFNESIFNSCPIHNAKCHLYNEGFLHKDENIKMLLNKVYDTLVDMGYVFKPIDKEFIKQYIDLYEI